MLFHTIHLFSAWCSWWHHVSNFDGHHSSTSLDPPRPSQWHHC